MAQTTLLAAGQTAATSSNLTLAAGVSAIIGLFTDAPSGDFPTKYTFWLQSTTPSVDRKLSDLSKLPPQVIVGPGTFRVVRPDISAGGINVGVCVDQ
jgi:hypothetical protein